MIEYLWKVMLELWEFVTANFDPARDTIDLAVVTLGIYWLLILIRGTRAIQILVGLIVLIALSVASELFELVTLGMILENFMSSAVLIIIVLFQHDIRRALARVGRGVFPSVSAQQESQNLEEVVRAVQVLSKRRIGALIVLERETALADQVDVGTSLDAEVSHELLTSLFLPPSPLHDGAVILQSGRISAAGCILPLTKRAHLPDGVGTRHRAAVGITEETDAVVVVVSEETGSISVVMSGEMVRDLEPANLRVMLRDALSGERRELPSSGSGLGSERGGTESAMNVLDPESAAEEGTKAVRPQPAGSGS